ncbi:MAG TPA: acetyl-CoA hydrolase/transferase C-terminal domain-containing protein [Syntrophomonadaceae bacterium]|nr:acetyl-CoA hydrolase/transferase C-terminal domain-containing protein [Syntrophomonadaceae bacterium]
MNNWQEMYKQKLTVPDEAIKLIGNGDRIIVPLANGQPEALVSALARSIKQGVIKDLVYLDALNVRCPEMHAPDVIDKINQVEIQLTVKENLNVVMFTVSPMDRLGFFSTGVNPDYVYAVAKQDPRPVILLEVNEKMPRTHGNNYLHISEVDALVENTVSLLCLPENPVTKEDEIIAGYIVEQIPDGACLQLGSGGIPNTIGKFLKDKKDLSVHTEMLCDAYRDLYMQGVITSREKTYMSGKWLASFVLGSQELYNFVAGNPMIEISGAEAVVDPQIASLNDKLVSINTIQEIDLSGQCSPPGAALRQHPHISGEANFVDAAWQSRGGKSILAAYSTYMDQEGRIQSTIVPAVNNFVSIGRTDTQYVVTEYGIVYLKGRSINSRAEELINIAHPDFRDWLKFEFKKLIY